MQYFLGRVGCHREGEKLRRMGFAAVAMASSALMDWPWLSIRVIVFGALPEVRTHEFLGKICCAALVLFRVSPRLHARPPPRHGLVGMPWRPAARRRGCARPPDASLQACRRRARVWRDGPIAPASRLLRARMKVARKDRTLRSNMFENISVFDGSCSSRSARPSWWREDPYRSLQ